MSTESTVRCAELEVREAELKAREAEFDALHKEYKRSVAEDEARRVKLDVDLSALEVRMRVLREREHTLYERERAVAARESVVRASSASRNVKQEAKRIFDHGVDTAYELQGLMAPGEAADAWAEELEEMLADADDDATNPGLELLMSMAQTTLDEALDLINEDRATSDVLDWAAVLMITVPDEIERARARLSLWQFMYGDSPGATPLERLQYQFALDLANKLVDILEGELTSVHGVWGRYNEAHEWVEGKYGEMKRRYEVATEMMTTARRARANKNWGLQMGLTMEVFNELRHLTPIIGEIRAVEPMVDQARSSFDRMARIASLFRRNLWGFNRWGKCWGLVRFEDAAEE